MIDLEPINLNVAKASFALANVPMYIARRLREDPAIVEIAVNNSSNDLVSAFHEHISKEPSSLREQVYPFAIAVALAIKQDVKSLRYIAGLDVEKFRWLKEVIDGLIDLQSASTTTATLTSDVQHFVPVGQPPLTSEVNRTSAGFSEVRFG